MFKFIMGMIVGALMYGQGPEIEKFFVDSGSVDVAIEKLEDIKNEIHESEKLKKESKNLLNESQEKLENAQKENEQIIKNAQEESEKLIIEINNKFFQTSESRKKITEQKILQMKENAIRDIKDASVIIAIESVTKLIKTSINKSKLDTLFEENLNQAKNTLKKTRA